MAGEDDSGGLLSLYPTNAEAVPPPAAEDGHAVAPADAEAATPSLPDRINTWMNKHLVDLGGAGSASPSGGAPDFITRLGIGMAGGPAGVADLSPEEKSAAGTRALMNFGLALMQGGGPSYTPRSFGQILASGLGSAEATETAAEQSAAVRRQAGAEFGLQQQEVGVKQQEAAIKLAEYKYKMQLLKQQTDQANEYLRRLTGSGGSAAPAAAPAAAGSLLAALPQPDARADISTWKDTPTAAAIIAEAKAQGVDPNWALAVAHQESQGNPAVADGDGGKSKGLFQIGVPEAASVGVNADALATPAGNIHAGVAYLKSLQGKYGNPALATLAYNAGQGTADGVLAGKQVIPKTTAQYVANVNSIIAGNPAGQPAAPPGGGGAGGPGYVPSSGVRTTLLPGAGPAAGAAAPGTPTAGLESLPAGQRQLFAAQLAAAVGNPEATNKVMADINAAVTDYAKRPNYRIMNQKEAADTFGTAYDPLAIYAINQVDGKPEVIQSGKPPVPLQDTPEGQASKIALDLSKTTLDNAQKASDQGKKIRNDTAQLRALSPLVGGADVLANKVENMIPLMQSLGIGTPEEQQRMTAQSAFQSVASRLILNMRDAGMSRLSNMDLEFLKNAAPNIGQNPAARAALLDAIETMANRQMAENSFAQQYFMQHHNTIGLDDAMEKPPSQGGLGPALARAPSYNAGEQAHKDFLEGLRPGQMYIKPNGTAGYAPAEQ